MTLFTMVCLGDQLRVPLYCLWYIPKQYNTLVRNLLCCTKNAIKLVVHITDFAKKTKEVTNTKLIIQTLVVFHTL